MKESVMLVCLYISIDGGFCPYESSVSPALWRLFDGGQSVGVGSARCWFRWLARGQVGESWLIARQVDLVQKRLV